MTTSIASKAHAEEQSVLSAILTDLTALKARVDQLVTDFNGHTHGGITAGAGTSSGATNSTAPAVTLTTAA